jgi:hypothetical protein
MESDRKALGLKMSKTKFAKMDELNSELMAYETKQIRRGNRTGTMTKTVPKFEGAEALSDIVDAMTSGLFHTHGDGAHGHGKVYYANNGSKQKETFANLFSIYNDEEVYAHAQRLFPDTTKRFTEIMEKGQ